MAQQTVETPDGTTAVTRGTARGVDWLQCVPDPSADVADVFDALDATECWIGRDRHTQTVVLCFYGDGLDRLWCFGAGAAGQPPPPFDLLFVDIVNKRPPQAVPAKYQTLLGRDQSLPSRPSVDDLPTAVQVIFEQLEIELVDAAD